MVSQIAHARKVGLKNLAREAKQQNLTREAKP
jgi:hypothetical protein